MIPKSLRKYFLRPRVSPIEEPEVLGTSSKAPLMIGVTGGAGSGKSSVCRKIVESLEQKEPSCTEGSVVVVVVDQDCFYRELNEAEKARAAKGEYNFDHPDAFDNELMKQSVSDLSKGHRVDLPVFDFNTNARSKTEKKTIYQADVILLEGIFVLYDREIRDELALKLFVDSDNDTRLARRIQRDIQKRGRTPEGIKEQYFKYVKPTFEEFTLPTKEYADFVIPRADANVSIQMLVQHIRYVLEGRNNTAGSSSATRKRTYKVSDSLWYPSSEDSAEFSFDSVFS